MVHGTQTFRTHVSGLTEAAQQHAGDFQDAVDQLLQPWQRRATAVYSATKLCQRKITAQHR